MIDFFDGESNGICNLRNPTLPPLRSLEERSHIFGFSFPESRIFSGPLWYPICLRFSGILRDLQLLELPLKKDGLWGKSTLERGGRGVGRPGGSPEIWAQGPKPVSPLKGGTLEAARGESCETRECHGWRHPRGNMRVGPPGWFRGDAFPRGIL